MVPGWIKKKPVTDPTIIFSTLHTAQGKKLYRRRSMLVYNYESDFKIALSNSNWRLSSGRSADFSANEIKKK